MKFKATGIIVLLLVIYKGLSIFYSDKTLDAPSLPPASVATVHRKETARPDETRANTPDNRLDQIPKFSSEDIAAGKSLAAAYCQSCHLLPQPEWLDKTTWYRSVMPSMSVLMGRYMKAASEESADHIPLDYYEPGEGGERVRSAQVFPSKPLVTADQWRQLVAWFVSEAPEKPILFDEPLKIALSGFPYKVHKLPTASDDTPAINTIKIRRRSNQIMVGEAASNSLKIFDKAGRQLSRVGFAGPPVQINEISENNFIVTDMGSFMAIDKYLGELVLLKQDPISQQWNRTLLLEKLPRPVHATFADLNGDGQRDIVVSEFGHWTGSLTWYENKTSKWVPHQLDNLPGNLNNYVTDMNRDGLPDIVVLRSHGDEGILIYYNKGNGEFEKTSVVRFPPCYGSNFLELVDFNKDGFPDILMTNGDNGDYPPILKRFHGVRLFINQKDGSFRQEQFFPLYGAVRAKAFDYDLDGDMDIAAIAFFPDFGGNLRDSFVLLENQGEKGFSAHSFSEANSGRWLAMDVADIDNDGDADIVLGANNSAEGLPSVLRDRWHASPQSIIWLENLAK